MLSRVLRLAPWASVSVALAIQASVSQATSVIPSDPQHVRSLDGTWRFKLEQAGGYDGPVRIGGKPWPIVLPKHFEPFQELNYREDAGWKDLKVPGNWEMAGFSPATYNQPDNAIGMFRLEFDVPPDWAGHVVKLNFDGVQNGAEVYLNGKPVNVDEPSEGRANFHQGGYDAFQADLTPVVKFGQKNLLAIRVYKNTKAVDLDTGDYFFLGGIHRGVTLFAVPQTHLDDLAVRTTVEQNGNAELRVLLAVTRPAGAKASMQLEGQPPVDGTADADGKIELAQHLEVPKLWSAEHPNLYTLAVDVKDSNGQVIERVTKRIGIREVSIRGGILLVNNVPVKLTGMCRHDQAANLGSALDDAVWRKDVAMMKAANVNSIRTSHYPYGSRFYDICDELGMYVMDEEAACWTPTDTDELTPAFQQHARELVRRDKNHPCVIIWAVGNENGKGKNNKLAAEEIRKIDPTRPRLVSWRDSEEGDVEIDDRHYTPPGDIAKAEKLPRRAQFPMTYLENPNDWELRNAADQGNWELWAMVIDRTWREVWKDEHVPGSFNWEWVDRAVADKCPTKLYDYFPATGINDVKVKGLVDAFRNPRPGVYDIKMAYAPIAVDPKVSVEGSTATLHLTNRYSFTDLSELKTAWHLIRAGKDVASGTTTAHLAPRSKGELKLDLPEQALKEADALRVDFDHAEGGNVVTYELRLRAEPETAPTLQDASGVGIKFPRLNLVPVTYGNNTIGWRVIQRHPAKLVNITIQHDGGAAPIKVADDVALYAMPLAQVARMDGDLMIEDDREHAVVGHVHTDFHDGDFSYKLEWTKPNAKPAAKGRNNRRPPAQGATDVQEFGWIFEASAADDHFSWHRKGYWSWYPADNINRLAGTATPDSADVDITKMSRPDSFDFNSTKYNCDWAMLAEPSGRGIGVTFTPGTRHQVRAGTATNGDHILVVNKYCCPPRDISSNIVPDQYFTLSQGQASEGHFMVGTTRTAPETAASSGK